MTTKIYNIAFAVDVFYGLLEIGNLNENQRKDSLELTGFHGKRRYFSKVLKNGQPHIEVLTDHELYIFDDNQSFIKTPTFSFYKGEQSGIYPYQINLKGSSIPNLHIVLDQVILKDIEPTKNTFNCNFKYWVSRPLDFDTIKKTTGYISFNQSSTRDTRITEISSTKELLFPGTIGTTARDSLLVSVYEVSGELFYKFNPKEFPFDCYKIQLPISALGPSDQVRMSFDPSRVENEINLSTLSLNGWQWDSEKPIYATIDNSFAYKHGVLTSINEREKTQKAEYKTLNIWLAVARKQWGAYLMIVLPLYFLGLLPILFLLVRNEKFNKIQEQILGVTITVVLFAFNIVQLAPDKDSFTRAYLILIVAFACNIGCLLFTNVFGKEFDEMAEKPKYMLTIRKQFPYIWWAIFTVIYLALIPNTWDMHIKMP
jgi:hypothetical protein